MSYETLLLLFVVAGVQLLNQIAVFWQFNSKVKSLTASAAANHAETEEQRQRVLSAAVSDVYQILLSSFIVTLLLLIYIGHSLGSY
jgi:hypothetical protein